MAIDSRIKRQAVISVARPWLPARIVPDGTISQFDRQTIGHGYGGILAGEAVDTSAGFICARNAAVNKPTATSAINIATATASIEC